MVNSITMKLFIKSINWRVYHLTISKFSNKAKYFATNGIFKKQILEIDMATKFCTKILKVNRTKLKPRKYLNKNRNKINKELNKQRIN